MIKINHHIVVIKVKKRNIYIYVKIVSFKGVNILYLCSQ